MPRPAESFKHTDTAYNRPNRHFVCGHECEGKTCALGPDARGRCRADFVTDNNRRAGECIPARGQYNRVTGETTNKQRWFCTRDASRGGACKDGPRPDGSCCLQLAPCRPKASLRRRRGTAVVLLAILPFAFIIILFAGRPESLDHPLNPGTISAAHSTAGMTCASCHVAPDGALAMLTDFHSDRAFIDAHRCIDCHHEIGGSDGSTLFTAHTLPSDHLARLTQRTNPSASPTAAPFLVGLASKLAVDGGEIACATCHQEHHGTNADLKHLTNAQCQVCHAEQFHSFSSGHPEFTSYPYRRRTRIFFDHETHFSEDFKSAEFKQHAKVACADCHTEQTDGGMMLTKSFENTCADCHHSNTTFGKWEILAFPKIDTRRIEDQLAPEVAEKLAGWESASARQISPLLRILIGEQKVESLYPLRKASDEEKVAAASFAKVLVEEIYGGEAEAAGAFEQRLLGSALLKDVAPEQARRLGTSLAAIFANLRGRGNAAPGADGSAPPPVVATTDFGGTFTYQPDAGSMTYQPGGHADPLMKAILDVAASKVGKVDHAEELLGGASDFWQGFDTTGAGKCLKCHTLDKRPDATMRINWNPAAPDTEARPITKFKHRSHVRLPELVRHNHLLANEACSACHQLDTTPAGVESYRALFSAENHNPHRYRSGFNPLALSNCATCHTENRAGDSCLLCHQYHATPSPITPALVDLLAGKDRPQTPAESEDEPGEPPPAEPEPEEGESDLLIPEGEGEGEGDSLIPGGDDEGEGDSLIPGGDEAEGDSLIPSGDEEEGDSLIPGGDEDEGDSLIPGEDEEEGDSLIPSEDEEESESLIPTEEESENGDSLLPADPAPSSETPVPAGS